MAKAEKDKNSQKHMVFIVCALIALIIVSAVLIILDESKKTNLVRQNVIECSKDSDCVRKQVTCCPCSSGGKEICIGKTNTSFNQPSRCPAANELVCMQVYSCESKPCGCVDCKCVFS